MAAEGIDVNETMLASQGEDLANQIGLDARLVRPSFTRKGECDLVTIELVEGADDFVIASLGALDTRRLEIISGMILPPK